jgi:leucyl aminopeptidase
VNLPKVELASGSGQGDAVALAWFKGTGEKSPKPEYVGERNAALEELEKKLTQSKHFAGKSREVSLLRFYPFGDFSNTVLFGLGAKKDLEPEELRRAGGALYQLQKRERLSKLTLRADSVFTGAGEAQVGAYLQALAEGYWLSSYEYKDLKKTETEAFVPSGLEVAGLKGAAAKKAIERGELLAGAINFARSLGDRPGNHLTPTILAELAQKMAKEHGIGFRALGAKELEKEKMGLFLGVSMGSEEEPKLIILEYKGGKKGDKPIALVGKGITFDSGGISIKPAAKMEEMKYDMMGAGAVVGTLQSIASLKLPINVTGYIAAAENMPSGRAQKPGDVRRSLSGKTVEIVNTDAEGRLVLADTIEYAQREKPQAMIDFATLTGAVTVALGGVTSGIMGNHPGLIQRVKEASAASGERVWELPLYEEYEEDLKSFYADIKNSGQRDAGSSKGGIFLKYFVDPKLPWVHCDIAGSAWGRSDISYLSKKYATGVMVRLMTHLLESWKPL